MRRVRRRIDEKNERAGRRSAQGEESLGIICLLTLTSIPVSLALRLLSKGHAELVWRYSSSET